MVVMSVLVPLSATLIGIGWFAVNSLQTANIDLKIARAEEILSLLFVGDIQSVAALQRQVAAPREYVDVPRGFDDETFGRWRVLVAFVEQFPSLTAAYVGYKDGSFIQASLLARQSRERKKAIDAPPGATRALWLISFNKSVRQEYWIFFDDAGDMLEQREIKDGTYDPRSRPWYQAAMRLRRQTMTDPYQFAYRGGIGITAAC
jgi:adenylate cyclase